MGANYGFKRLPFVFSCLFLCFCAACIVSDRWRTQRDPRACTMVVGVYGERERHTLPELCRNSPGSFVISSTLLYFSFLSRPVLPFFSFFFFVTTLSLLQFSPLTVIFFPSFFRTTDTNSESHSPETSLLRFVSLFIYLLV